MSTTTEKERKAKTIPLIVGVEILAEWQNRSENPVRQEKESHPMRRFYTHQSPVNLGGHCMVHGCYCQGYQGKFQGVCTNCCHGYSKHF